MPDEWLDKLAEALNTLEANSAMDWPGSYLDAFVALLPKEDVSADPKNQRPVILTAMMIRLWASVRAQDYLAQLCTLVTVGIRGVVPGGDALSCVLPSGVLYPACRIVCLRVPCLVLCVSCPLSSFPYPAPMCPVYKVSNLRAEPVICSSPSN